MDIYFNMANIHVNMTGLFASGTTLLSSMNSSSLFKRSDWSVGGVSTRIDIVGFKS